MCPHVDGHDVGGAGGGGSSYAGDIALAATVTNRTGPASAANGGYGSTAAAQRGDDGYVTIEY